MKKTYIATILAIFITAPSMGQTETVDPFANWTDEQYQAWEDSVNLAQFPPAYPQTLDSSLIVDEPDGPTKVIARSVNNSHVPSSVVVSTSKEVGQIAMASGTTPSGARTYTIPIDVYPGINGFQPSLALAYNSQQGNGELGMGWAVAGLSHICRGGKSIYYDGRTDGIKMDDGDSFVLDGIRLVKLSVTGDYVLYESEQGNVKAKGYHSGDVMKYFEVFYPDGNKGVFGSSSNTTNRLEYPLFSLADLHGNTIEYSYNYNTFGNTYEIAKISYNGASVEFQYSSTRTDPVLAFSGGVKVLKEKLLKSITCKLGTCVLGTYTLTYSEEKDRSVLTQVDYGAGGKSYNPLRFYYGEGLTATAYNTSTTQLTQFYTFDNAAAMMLVRGKFDYDQGADGLIMLPAKNTYWQYHKHHTLFRNSKKYFKNYYTGDESIYLYTGLKNTFSYPTATLTTGTGFVDIFCADLEGKQDECVVKVNNSVENNLDQVTFSVYHSYVITGLVHLYDRTFTFSTVFTDDSGNKSIQPKYYYVGDFNGDGKMEVMAISINAPFGDTTKQTTCYIFDLVNSKILYQGHFVSFNKQLAGSDQSDFTVAENNSDKIIPADFDGDGKTDICLINGSGTYLYTFDISGTTFTPRLVGTYTGLKKTNLEYCDLLPGDFNGDGLMDLLVSPSSNATTNTSQWSMYSSMGNGQFVAHLFSGAAKGTDDASRFLLQDVNGDGCVDLLKCGVSGFSTYLNNCRNVGTFLSSTTFTDNSAFVSTNINSRNHFTQLLSVKDGVVTKYAFPRNDSKELMLTGAANSLGVIDKNKYRAINDGTGPQLYSRGYGAVFPYVNISEPIIVLEETETYMNGSKVDGYTFEYTNAVIHRQGLGFRGFEKVADYNMKHQYHYRQYEPYRYSLLKLEHGPGFEQSLTYSVSIASNKRLKTLMTQKVEKDLLKDITATTSYVYDAYGYPTEESTTCTGGISVKKANTYLSTTTVADGYNLGFLIDQLTTVTRNGATYTERMFIPARSNRRPSVILTYKDGNQVGFQSFDYYTNGLVKKENTRAYASSNTQSTSYVYDAYGRLTKKTNPMGHVTTYSYNAQGRLATVTDKYGGTTTYVYDELGREKQVTFTDNTVATTTFSWSSLGTNGLYAVTKAKTGATTTTTIYDALNREVRTQQKRLNSQNHNVDKIYDSYGRLQKVSLPFLASPALWNVYTYDIHDRVLSYTEASGRSTTSSYSGNTVTTTADGITTTKEYDAQGNLLAVTDPADTITYNLAADGQPTSIVAPGDVTTSFAYDQYRRRTSLTDPSQGTTSYEYDAAGNVSKETNANGEATQYTFDAYNRMTSATAPEFSTTYAYNSNGDLASVASSNGTAKSFTYDNLGRMTSWKENAVDGKWLQKDYTYANGNVSSIKYTSQSGVLGTESFTYTNGVLTETRLNGTTVIFKLNTENVFAQPTQITTGAITRTYGYDSYGLPVSRSAKNGNVVYQNFSYAYDPTTLNLLSRTDNKRNITEAFGYDGLNRLTSFAGKTAAYDVKGNLTSMSDVGTYSYDNTQKPYAISGISQTGSLIPARSQDVTYTSFHRPATIEENGYRAAFTYNSDYDRVKMSVTQNGNAVLTRYYLGGCYEYDQGATSSKEFLYLGGDYYNATAVLQKMGSSTSLFYLLRDNLGSITNIVHQYAGHIYEYSYDAWGRMRDPSTHQVFTPDQQPSLYFGRGYTGHELLPWFGLVNMNARLYDPAIGRFLAPDPYVQSPDASQNFNRYSYCLNNPLKYTDESGELLGLSWISGFFKGVSKWVSGHGKWYSPFTMAYKNTYNDLKVVWGIVAKGSPFEILSRLTWQLPQTIVGYGYTSVQFVIKDIDYVGYYGGATYIVDIRHDGKRNANGITISNMINITTRKKVPMKDGKFAPYIDPLYRHEYGHYLQSQSVGPLYLLYYGIPSLGSEIIDKPHHSSFYTEKDADRRSTNYFKKRIPQDE